MRPSLRSAGPDGNRLALAQMRALRRAGVVALVAVAFLSLHFVLDHGAARARQAQEAAAQSKPVVSGAGALGKIGL